MFWIFAAVVLLLTVYHRGFRKFAGYGAITIVVIGAIIWATTALDNASKKRLEAERLAKFEAATAHCRQEDKNAEVDCLLTVKANEK